MHVSRSGGSLGAIGAPDVSLLTQQLQQVMLSQIESDDTANKLAAILA